MDTNLPQETGAREPAYRLDCPSRTIIDVLANKWVLYVLGLLERNDRPMRFSELRRAVEGVTQKSLTQTLRALERDGFIDRRVYATVPPRVEYRLADLGREAGRLLGAIGDWALNNAPRVVAAREAFDSAPPEHATATPWTARRP
ncbi:helix-turn-helix domain-containing protein [Streptomyces sp. NPDC026672]|uniref:winged helix-turn-helix transcriptional regulator n=1 Tax=unclassified Streptomyces TaxID=2593676 RepID=UPI0033CD43FE